MGALKHRIFSGPKVLFCRLNNTCNLNCLFCVHHGTTARVPTKETRLKMETLDRVFDDCRKLNVGHICFSAKGEPTLHPDFESIVHNATAKGLAVTLVTNGLFPSKLLKTVCRIHAVKFSLSATNAKDFFRIHQPQDPSDFDTVINNIRLLGRAKSRKSRTSLNFVLHALNYHSLPAVIDLARRVNIDELRIKCEHVEHRASPLALTQPLTKKAEKLLLAAYRKGHLRRVKNNLLAHYAETGKFLPAVADCRKLIQTKLVFLHSFASKLALYVKLLTSFVLRPCHMGWFVTFLTEGGDVTACCSTQKSVKIGNIHDKGLAKLWMSTRYRRVRLKAVSGFFQKKMYDQLCRGRFLLRENATLQSLRLLCQRDASRNGCRVFDLEAAQLKSLH